MSEHHDVTDPQAPVPDTLTAEMIGEDLSFANEYGGWTNYAIQEDGSLLANLFGPAGEIAKTFRVEFTITEQK